ncbi:MAG: ACT domain-containing protein [Verrucomicrobiota bacterium]
MIAAKHCKEVSVRVMNDIGILAQLTKIVADKGVNIRAAAAWVEDENKGVVRLVTDDNLRALDALRAHNYAPTEIDSVEVLMHHSPGMLSSVCEKIGSGGVNIHYLYASAPVSNETCLVVLSTSDNARALVLLNG